MQLIDPDVVKSRALVIDPNPTSRSILAAQLRDFGVGTVVQCSRIHDARRQLEARPFDVVLCEHQFQSDGYTGQNLLDDLRRNQLLPFSTVFIMVTGEASYTLVADAAESALDSFLIKPHTAAALGQRIGQARLRKKSLGAIFTAIEEQNFDHAARLCLERFSARGPFWMYAARIGSELLLRQGRHDAAKQLYEAVLETGALPWAKLGIARAQIDANQRSQALRTLEGLIGEQPTYVDAYDVMGRVQVEQGDLSEALATYRKASSLTPGSITRLQKHGMLAFYMGDRDEAAKMLDRAALMGISSKMFDYQSLVLLAFLRFYARDTKALQRCQDNLAHALEQVPQSKRLQRFVAIVRTLSLMLSKQVGAVVTEVREMASELRDPGFDIEAACNLLALMSQLTAAELRLDGLDEWVNTMALRFASTKGLTELLARATEIHPPSAESVRAAHLRIGEMAEDALSNTLRDDPRAAVMALLGHIDSTLNAKLIDIARMTLQRHRDKIADADELSKQVESLRSRFATGAGLPSMGQGARQAGGLTLREKKSVDTPPVDTLADAPVTVEDGDTSAQAA